MVMVKASFLVVVFSMGVLAPAIAQNGQNRKPRKKLKELLMMADSLRLQLRQSADRGRMLQWGDSLLMAELGKSKMSEKKKQRFMKHYAKIQRRLSLYDPTQHIAVGLRFQGKKVLKLLSAFGGIQICPFS